MPPSRSFVLLVAAVFAVFAFGIIWFSSVWGVGTTADSIQYLAGAEQIANGQSPATLSRHWPPLYPLTISLLSLLLDDIQLSARILQATLFALVAPLMLLCLLSLRRGSAFTAFVVVIYFVLHIHSYDILYMVLSEGLFIVLLLVQVILAVRFLLTRRLSWLFGAGMAMGLAVLTRYAGLGFLGGVTLFFLLADRQTWNFRLQNAAIYSAVALTLPIAWLVYSTWAGSTDSPRVLAYNPVSLEALTVMLETMATWVSGSTGDWWAWPLLILTALLVANTCRTQTTDDEVAVCVTRMLTVGALSYLGFLLVSIALFDYYTPLNERLLFPAFNWVLLAFGIAVQARYTDRLWAATTLQCLMLTIVVLGLPDYVQKVSQRMKDGEGFFSRAVREMPLLGLLPAIHTPTFFSNAPELINLHTEKEGRLLPPFVDTASNTWRDEYMAEMEAMVKEVEEGSAAIAHFRSFEWRSYLPDCGVFDELKSVHQIYDGPDGTLYISTKQQWELIDWGMVSKPEGAEG